MSLNTLNLKQKQGGRVIKQADRSSTFKFALQDSNGALINLNGEEASISLFNPNIEKYWSSKATVKDAEVEFRLPGNIEENDYVLEITVGGYVFPSDNDFIIEVVKGFKDLPDMETGLRYKQTIEEITQDYIVRSDNKLKENLDGITDQRLKIDKANAEILKNINDTGNKYINDINTNYANVKLEFDQNVQKRKNEFTTIADNNLKTFKETSNEALSNIKNTGDGYVSAILSVYGSAKNDFDTNASQKNTDLKNNYDTYLSNMGQKEKSFNANYQTNLTSINQKADDVVALIGRKKEELLQEVDGQVKISADQYLSEYKNKIDEFDEKIQENTNKINGKVDKVSGEVINLTLSDGLSGYIKAKKDAVGGVRLWGKVDITNSNPIKKYYTWATLPKGYTCNRFTGFSLYSYILNGHVNIIPGMAVTDDGRIRYIGIINENDKIEVGSTNEFTFYFKTEEAW